VILPNFYRDFNTSLLITQSAQHLTTMGYNY